MSFSVDSLKSSEISDATFRDCYFRRTDLTNSTIRDCSFERCRFEQIDVSDVTQIHGASLRDCEVFSVVRSSEETAIFAPESIAGTLRSGVSDSGSTSGCRDRAGRSYRDGRSARTYDPHVPRVLSFDRSKRIHVQTTTGKQSQHLLRSGPAFSQGYGVVDEIEYKGGGVRGATGSGYPSMTCNGRSNRLTATSRSFWKASAPDRPPRPPGPLAGRYQSRESGTSSHAPPCSIDAWLTSPGRVMSIAASMPSSGSVPSRTASTKSSI